MNADLYLRGRLENSGLPMYLALISSIAGVGSMISSAAMPATGLPSTTRGQSPHASMVVRPTSSKRRQISGMSSIRIQWYWTFCRSEMSAVLRANSVETPATTRSCSVVSAPPSMRTRIMKYSSCSSSASSFEVRAPEMPCLRWV